MTRITLAPNASGTGTLTLAAPNTNTDYVVTLPDATSTLVSTTATQTLTNKTLTTPVISGGTITGATVSGSTVDGTNSIGFKNVPPVGTKTASYTLATGDVGKYVQLGTSGAIVIPDATFAEGDAIVVFNNTSGNITITCTITTAYIAGTDADKATVTLATRGVASIFFISGTVCVITGNVT